MSDAYEDPIIFGFFNKASLVPVSHPLSRLAHRKWRMHALLHSRGIPAVSPVLSAHGRHVSHADHDFQFERLDRMRLLILLI